MSAKTKTNGDILSRFGFDLVDHLEVLRGKGMGVQNIEIHDSAQASPAALRVWEDSNFPYRLPEDLRAFLCGSNGFSLAWTSKQRPPTPEEEEGSGGETVVGRIRVDPLSAITRVPLDGDDLRNLASSRARATVAAVATVEARSLLVRRSSPLFSCSDHDSNCRDGEGGRCYSGGVVVAATASDASSSGMTNTNCCTTTGGAYGIAAFSLDSSCEVGRVALVYGGAPVVGGNVDGDVDNSVGGTHRGSCRGTQRERGSSGKKTPTIQELSNPEVWLQDLSCRWYFLADSFLHYFRMMVVHLGILGWQQAFTPVGLSPNTEQAFV